jgi:hypothetical protein
LRQYARERAARFEERPAVERLAAEDNDYLTLEQAAAMLGVAVWQLEGVIREYPTMPRRFHLRTGRVVASSAATSACMPAPWASPMSSGRWSDIGVYYDDDTPAGPSAPPQNLPNGVVALCGDCGDRQPTQRAREFIGGTYFDRESTRPDTRCSSCPTRKPWSSKLTNEAENRRKQWQRLRSVLRLSR